MKPLRSLLRRHLGAARLLAAPLLVALAALAALAFGQPRQGRAEDAIDVAFPREVRTLDANYSNTRELDIISLLIDDALFYVHHDTLAITPLLAQSYRFADERTLDIELRRDVRFHDGAPLTAEDVVYTYQWLLDPESQALFAERFRAWLERVEATGPFSVRFHMRTPYAMALYDLALYSRIRTRGAYHPSGAPNPNALATAHNGAGPYRVRRFVSGEILELERFEGYRSDSPKAGPGIGAIRIRVIPDFSTQAAELISGGVGWTYNVPTDIAEDVARTGEAQFVSGPSMRSGYFVFDAEGRVSPSGPLTDVRVRRALNLAIDREAIVDNLLRGAARVIHTPCLAVQFGCAQDVARYDYDPAHARALLREAGYADGFALDVWTARDKDVVEAVAEMWARIGVSARVRYVKQAALTRGLEQNEVGVYFTSYGSFGVPDAGAILPDRFGADYRSAMHGDAQVDDAIAAALATYDPDIRRDRFAEALRRITAQAYTAPLFEFPQNFLVSPDVDYVQPADGLPRLFLLRWRDDAGT
jgi:peptide/nickel transport system substrate-binding protein